MQFPITPGEPIVVPMKVYGSEDVSEMEALLDTGACLVTLPPDEALGLGYSVSDAPLVNIVTASGTIAVPRVMLTRVEIGPFSEFNVPALCLALPGGTASCLLGLNLLCRFKVELDFPNGTISIVRP